MIRLIQRRLIIPRGDTGSFTIPIQGTVEDGDIAVFSIFDPMTHTTIFEKELEFTGLEENLTIPLTHSDTVNLIPKKYVWDIKIYTNPQYNGTKLINGDTVDSYYAGFSYPVCEITLSRDRR